MWELPDYDVPWLTWVAEDVIFGGFCLLVIVLVGWISVRYIHRNRSRTALIGHHVLITGGSAGIGLAIAEDCAKRGADIITLVARNRAKLITAQSTVSHALGYPKRQAVKILSLDLSGNPEDVEEAIRKHQEEVGPVTLLVNNAGTATCAKVEDASAGEFERLMRVNYLSAVAVTRAVLPFMKKEDATTERKHIAFVSSQAGFLGIFGLAGYSASKFALRGFAEALEMEVKPFGIEVTIAFPPDTDTPGFHEEQLGKPEETKKISESAGLFQPKEVAECLMDDIIVGNYYSSPGMDGWMLKHINAGMTDCSFIELVFQAVLLGPLRIIGWFYKQHFYSLVKSCNIKKNRK